MTILRFKVVLAAILIKININNRKTRPFSQFYSLVTSKYVPLTTNIFKMIHSIEIQLNFSAII